MKFVVMVADRAGRNPQTLALVMQGLREMGLSGTRLVLRGDGDSSLMDLLTRVAELRGATTVLEHGPREDGQAHGRAERTVKTIEETVRVQLTDLEQRTGKSVDYRGNLFGWLVRHAVDLANKRLVGRDGTTAWQRMRGRPYRGQLLRFGAPVMHRLAGDPIGGGSS